MPTGIGCTVYADGVRLADGSVGDPETAPTVLSGLQVSWGRDTTVDQPGASQLAFDLMDAPGGGSFAERLRTGTPVDVYATGTIYPDPTESTWPDPGFESGTPPGTVPSNAATRLATAHPATGARSLRIRPKDPARRAGAVLAPAPFSAPGTDPDAWDTIPTTAPGQTWSITASVWAPPGARITVRPVLFTGPYASSYYVLNTPATSLAGNGAWQQVGPLEVVPNVLGAWLGLQVTSYPTGPTWDDLDPSWTWDTLPDVLPFPSWSWNDYADVYVDDVEVLAPTEGTTSSVLVFSGRVSALETSWNDSTGTPGVKVAAVDFTADLENVRVGDEPWPVEAMGDRFNRIIALTGQDVTADIDDTVAPILVSWRDVDSQAATGLLEELASSVDAVMWSATHQVTGPYLAVEDPRNRVSQWLLVLDETTGLVTVIPNPGHTTGTTLSACDVLADDVTWTQDTQDVMTRAAVTWLEQGVDEDGQPATTERTYTLIEEPLEAKYGVRSVSLSTQLQAEQDAATVADNLLARTSISDWRASGLVIDDFELDDADEDDTTRLLTLLDGTSRNGLAISLTDLPAWTPAGDVVPVYLEGGTYTFDDGAWVLDLNVSNATAQGASAAWDDLPTAWTWDMFDPAMTWNDLRGAAVDEGTAA